MKEKRTQQISKYDLNGTSFFNGVEFQRIDNPELIITAKKNQQGKIEVQLTLNEKERIKSQRNE